MLTYFFGFVNTFLIIYFRYFCAFLFLTSLDVMLTYFFAAVNTYFVGVYPRF
jgi:hypothetical protein